MIIKKPIVADFGQKSTLALPESNLPKLPPPTTSEPQIIGYTKTILQKNTNPTSNIFAQQTTSFTPRPVEHLSPTPSQTLLEKPFPSGSTVSPSENLPNILESTSGPVSTNNIEVPLSQENLTAADNLDLPPPPPSESDTTDIPAPPPTSSPTPLDTTDLLPLTPIDTINTSPTAGQSQEEPVPQEAAETKKSSRKT